MTARLLLLAFAASLGCVPAPGGRCAVDADCAFSTTCQAGLCRAAPAAPPLGVGWISPADGAWSAGAPVALALTADAASVTVTAGPLAIALTAGPDGVFRGTLDPARLPDGATALSPRSGARAGPSRTLLLDRQGPRVALSLPVAPSGAFLRDQVIQVSATVDDGAGSGVDEASLALVAEGLAPIAGTRVGRAEWTFALPLRAPAFPALSGPLALRAVARDRLGNEGRADAALPVTRIRWRKDVGGGLPVRSSPALDAAHLYVGTDQGRVAALDRQTGIELWSHALRGPVSASPARGDALVYAASEGGDFAALDAATGEARWTCSDPSWRLLASPALDASGTVFVSNASPQQQGAVTVQGGVLALQPSFAAGGCSVFGATGGGASSVAIARDGTLLVGGQDQRAHALGFDGAAFHERWSAALTGDATTSPAVGARDLAVFGAGDGRLSWLSGGAAVQAAALGEKLLASPVLAFDTALLQGRDGTLGPFPGPTQPAAQDAPRYVAFQLPSAGFIESTPAVGKDGVVYVAAGRSLRAMAPQGALLWEAPLGGEATASSPVLGCDGTLYVGDASGAVLAVVTDSPGLAPGWPRFRHDARGTGNAASPLCE